MVGYFRFFLATLVLLTHTGSDLQGFNQGVSAVVCFYILAGFVVCSLLTKVFDPDNPRYFRFYYERALRIFPLYIYVLSLTALFVYFTGYGDPGFSLFKFIKNVLIIPLNYYLYTDNVVLSRQGYWLVPPAWSLGVELQAYLVLPFIVFYPRLKAVLGVLSFLIFCLAGFGVFDSDIFGYRLLPGILFIFILGVSICRNKYGTADRFDRYFPKAIYITLVFLFVVLGIKGRLIAPYVRETIIGLFIGIPAISFLESGVKKARWNSLVGDLSYGLFLSHFLAMWLVDYFSIFQKEQSLGIYLLIVFFISLMISAAGIVIVESRLKKYRFKLSKTRQG